MFYWLRLPITLLFSLLFIASPVAGQVQQSKIDVARTDEQVEQLVKAVDKYYANFKVSSALKFADKRIEKQYRQAHVKAWEKADFDGNGRLDLLITGTHYNEESKVICLLDMGNGKLVLEPFDRQFYRACSVATVSYEGTQPFVNYTDFAKPFLAIDKLEDKKSFHLIYKYGGFIEYNPQANSQVLSDSIIYESDFAYHEVQEEKLTLTGTGAAIYYSCTYPVLDTAKKTYITQQTSVTAQALADIRGMASYLLGQPLQPHYHTGHNHVPYTTLTISYRNGQRIRVRDEGETGTFGLIRLYALLGQLRKSQVWQSAKP